MPQPEVIKSLSRGDEIKVTFKSIGMYNAGTPESHIGTVVKKISDDGDDPFSYKIIYRTQGGGVFLLDCKVEYIYTHENDKLQHLEGINAKLVPVEELNEDSSEEEV